MFDLKRKKMFLAGVLGLMVFVLGAAEPYSIQVSTDKKDALYNAGEKITFSIVLLKDKTPLPGKKITYTLRKDGEKTQAGSLTTLESPVTVETSLAKPGFVLCSAIFKPEEKDSKPVVGYGGAGVEPLKIKAARQVPADFKEFWDKKLAELNKLPMKPVLTSVEPPAKLKGKLECFDVKINCLGGKDVSGYYVRPVNAKPKSLPAMITYHGAGVRSANLPTYLALQGRLVMDINAHGIENGKPREFYEKLRSGELAGYPYFNCDDKEKYYFLGLYLRAYRALQFLKAQPEWDGKTLIVWGSSQGGAQALTIAGLDPQVTFCAAFVPAMCDHYGVFNDRRSGWPQAIAAKGKDKQLKDKIVETMGYFDSANFAQNIKADMVVVTAGFIDTTCCPASVYAAYNNINVPKKIINMPATGHGGTPETSREASKALKEHIDKLKK